MLRIYEIFTNLRNIYEFTKSLRIYEILTNLRNSYEILRNSTKSYELVLAVTNRLRNSFRVKLPLKSKQPRLGLIFWFGFLLRSLLWSCFCGGLSGSSWSKGDSRAGLSCFCGSAHRWLLLLIDAKEHAKLPKAILWACSAGVLVALVSRWFIFSWKPSLKGNGHVLKESTWWECDGFQFSNPFRFTSRYDPTSHIRATYDPYEPLTILRASYEPTSQLQAVTILYDPVKFKIQIGPFPIDNGNQRTTTTHSQVPVR